MLPAFLGPSGFIGDALGPSIGKHDDHTRLCSLRPTEQIESCQLVPTTHFRNEYLMSLPPELWWIVIELIASKAELCVLTRVCTFLRYSAVRQLYHTVMFEKLAPFIKFARCIIGISTLGGYTTKLTFRVFDTHVPGFYFALTFSKLLRSTLQNMTRLRHLSLYWGARFLSRRGRETRSDFFCSGMFDRCTFRLQTFSSNAILDKHLFLFLRCQREIWRISLERPFPGGTIPPSLNIAEILPRLAVLQTGEREVVHLLMHNRSVTHVQLAERIRPSEELIFSLSYSLGPVKAFYYNHTTVDSGALRALPLAAPYLQHITVAIFSADSVGNQTLYTRDSN
jgi:hypothetical protein